MLQYSKLNLKENPFKANIPNPEIDKSNKLIWAGLNNIKETISSIYRQASYSTHKQIILNWGPFGGGKTFAADYFIHSYTKYTKNDKSFIQVYLRSPKDGTKATKDFFRNFIDFLSFSKISETSKLIKNDLGEDKFKSLVAQTIKSEEFSEAICLLASNDSGILSLMRRYIYTGLTKTELKKLNLARNLEADTDYIKFLAAVIFIMIHSNNRFVLWIDEMEDLIYYLPKNYRTFSQILRDLFDTLSKDFTVFMNFTLSEPKESTIELLLGGAIWSRINRKVRFKELSVEDALEYIKDLLKYYQLVKGGVIPFTEDVVNKVIDQISPIDLTPRELNKYFGELIEFSCENDYPSITVEVLKMWLSFKELHG